MCGIFGYVGDKRNGAQIVLEGLKRLEYRGYDSWGVGIVPTDTSNHILIKKKVGKIGSANVVELPSSSLAFGHTRWATHGGVTQKNAHPHLDCKKQIAVIHNGIIENFQALKKKLVSKHNFNSETDTEIAAHLIEEKIKKLSLFDAVLATFKELKGNNALIVLHKDSSELVAVKNGSPLVIGFGENENYLASDPAALLPHTKRVHFLEDNHMVRIFKDEVNILDITTNKIVPIKKEILNWDTQETTKGSYEHFMAKEMHEQPQIIAKIAQASPDNYKKPLAMLEKYNDILFTGCGTASYACWAGFYLFTEIAHKRVTWCIASEFMPYHDFLTKKSLVLAVSQSGETMDLIQVLKLADRKSAKIGALVNVPGSTLHRMADFSVEIGSGPEKAVASTKAFIGMLCHILNLAFGMQDKLSENNILLTKASRATGDLLATTSWKHLEKIAKKLIKKDHLFVIGRGISNVAAIEIALKIKEISYVHAESVVGGELKHGPLALIEDGTPCIVVAPHDQHYDAIISSAMEVKARGGTIIGISPTQNDVFDEYIHIPDLKEASLIPAIVSGQILAYHMAVLKKLDPDKPRNLAKSVTVG